MDLPQVQQFQGVVNWNKKRRSKMRAKQQQQSASHHSELTEETKTKISIIQVDSFLKYRFFYNCMANFAKEFLLQTCRTGSEIASEMKSGSRWALGGAVCAVNWKIVKEMIF